MATPRTLADLSEVAPEKHDWYVPADDGGFRLDPELEKDIERFDADTAARDAAHQQEMAALDTRAERMTAELHDLAVSREVRAALEKAGVRDAFVSAVTALLRERMSFAVEAEDDEFRVLRVTVADAFGEVGVEFAVNTWLATEEADPFRPTLKATDGPVMARLRELRARMQ